MAEQKTYRPPEDWQHHPYIIMLRQLRYGDAEKNIEPAFNHKQLYNLPKDRKPGRTRGGRHYSYRGWNPDHNMKMVLALIDEILDTGRVPTDEENRLIASQVDEHDYTPCAELATLGMQYLADSSDAKVEAVPKGKGEQTFDVVLREIAYAHKNKLGNKTDAGLARIIAKRCTSLSARPPFIKVAVAEALSNQRILGWMRTEKVPSALQRYVDLPSDVELVMLGLALGATELQKQCLRRGLQTTLDNFAEREEEMFAEVDKEVAAILTDINRPAVTRYKGKDGFKHALDDLFVANGFAIYAATGKGHCNAFAVVRIFKELYPESEVAVTAETIKALLALKHQQYEKHEQQLRALAPLMGLDQQERGLDIMLMLLRLTHTHKHGPDQEEGAGFSSPSGNGNGHDNGHDKTNGNGNIGGILDQGPGGPEDGPAGGSGRGR